jgi:hypothetical protein
LLHTKFRAKWAELWWEAPIEGSVCIKFPQSRMKGEWHRLRPLSLYFQWLTLQISKLTKAVVLNSFPHGRFWQFVYKENVRCTRLMQRSLQVVIRQMFVLCSLKIEAQWSEPMSFRVHLTFSLYTNCQNRPCGKEFNTTAFVNLLICNVNVNIILWRNLNIVFMKLFPQSDLLRYQRV